MTINPWLLGILIVLGLAGAAYLMVDHYQLFPGYHIFVWSK